MSLRSLMIDKCDIYHLNKSSASPGYGLPGTVKNEYSNVADQTNVICHFGATKTQRAVGDPQTKLIEETNILFLIGTDIKANSKITNTLTGAEYISGEPRYIRNHHIEVKGYREVNL